MREKPELVTWSLRGRRPGSWFSFLWRNTKHSTTTNYDTITTWRIKRATIVRRQLMEIWCCLLAGNVAVEKLKIVFIKAEFLKWLECLRYVQHSTVATLKERRKMSWICELVADRSKPTLGPENDKVWLANWCGSWQRHEGEEVERLSQYVSARSSDLPAGGRQKLKRFFYAASDSLFVMRDPGWWLQLTWHVHFGAAEGERLCTDVLHMDEIKRVTKTQTGARCSKPKPGL